MAGIVVGIRVVITEYLGDEPQPGIVRCEFSDAEGRLWSFTEKSAIVSADAIDAQDAYPRPGVLMCRVVDHGSSGGAVAVEPEEFPDGVDATGESMRFEVRPENLVEWEWGGRSERPWSPPRENPTL